MTTFKFSNSSERKKIAVISVITSVLALVMISNLELGKFKNLGYLLSAILSFTYIMIYTRKSKYLIEEINIVNDTAKLYFFNKSKDHLEIKLAQTKILVKEEIIFFNSLNGENLGKATKESLIEKEQWNVLINELNQFISV